MCAVRGHVLDTGDVHAVRLPDNVRANDAARAAARAREQRARDPQRRLQTRHCAPPSFRSIPLRCRILYILFSSTVDSGTIPDSIIQSFFIRLLIAL